MEISKRFKFSLQALAQPSSVQIKLFPEFVNVADELALNWEDAIEDTDIDALPSSCRESIKVLDDYMLSISGKENEDLWCEDAVRNSIEWAKLRSLAKDALSSFGWLNDPLVEFDGNTYISE